MIRRFAAAAIVIGTPLWVCALAFGWPPALVAAGVLLCACGLLVLGDDYA